MRTWCHRAAAAIVLLVCGGCAKDPTTVLTGVSIDQTVPPLLILRTRVVSTTDPSRASGGERSSSELGDAGDRPGPFLFPLLLPLTVDASLAGPVTVTVEGLDWDTLAVLASGSASAEVRAQQSTSASVTLTAAAPPAGGDGGDDGGDGAATDGP